MLLNADTLLNSPHVIKIDFCNGPGCDEDARSPCKHKQESFDSDGNLSIFQMRSCCALHTDSTPINTPAGLELVCGVNPFGLLYCRCDIAFILRLSYFTGFIYSVLILAHPGCPRPKELACFHFPAVRHNLGLFME